MCTNQKKIYRDGKYKENNYRGKKGEEYEIVAYTKCGFCQECINEKANNWVIRNHYESKAHKEKCFITLTYAENPRFLIRKDLQDFIKRFRKEIKQKVRIFYSGEYGTISKRPHYHLIIYGWEDKNAIYKGINKKGNLILESEIIKKKWSKGITSYQSFNDKEIPYISLYETTKENMAYSYKTSLKTAKKMLEELKTAKDYKRVNIIKTLDEVIKKAYKEKAEYIEIKEFNGWSKGLGWNEFLKEYKKHKNYDFNEFIEDKEFVTPSPWVKKLANSGDENATKEMLLRSQELTTNLTALEKNLQGIKRLNNKQVQEKTEWQQKRNNIESI